VGLGHYCLLHHTKIKTTNILNFHSRTVLHLDIIKVFYLPTDAQEDCFKKNIKIYIKTAATCFGANTINSERII
jgi:hypothetical protein